MEEKYIGIIEDTLVKTLNGEKAIKDLSVGDEIYTYCIDSTNKELSSVTEKLNKGTQAVTKISTVSHSIEATNDQKFLVRTGDFNYEYKDLQELQVGDKLVIYSDAIVKTEAILTIESTGNKLVYNIIVESANSNFYGNEMVIHDFSVY